MGELAVGTIAAIAVACAPVLAQRSSRAVPSFLLSLAFALALAASLAAFVLLSVPFRSVFMNFSILPSAGRISSAVPFGAASVAGLISGAGLGMAVHDGEAWVSFLPTLFIHFISSSLSKQVGVDEFESKLGIVRQVVGCIIRPRVVLTVCNCIQLSSLTILSQPCEVLHCLDRLVVFSR